jgi:hypothetical protein
MNHPIVVGYRVYTLWRSERLGTIRNLRGEWRTLAEANDQADAALLQLPIVGVDVVKVTETLVSTVRRS